MSNLRVIRDFGLRFWLRYTWLRLRKAQMLYPASLLAEVPCPPHRDCACDACLAWRFLHEVAA